MPPMWSSSKKCQGSESRPRLSEFQQKLIKVQERRLACSGGSRAEEDQAGRGHPAQAPQKFVLCPNDMASKIRKAIALKMKRCARLGRS